MLPFLLAAAAMGNFLDTPITEKETEVGEDGKCSYGLSAMQGWRAQMEDDHIQMLSVSDALPNVSLFGVFDGHGGDMRAHYSARHFPKHLTDALDAGDLKLDGSRRASRQGEGGIRVVADGARQRAAAPAGRGVGAGPERLDLRPVPHLADVDRLRQHGDSRAVLARGGDAVPLSHDHKPHNPEEKARIEAAGSHVAGCWRVNGDLAVSRALGDFVYKRCETVAADRQAVTAFPEVRLAAAAPALARARPRTADCFGAARRARRRAPASSRAPPPGLNPALTTRDGSLMLHLPPCSQVITVARQADDEFAVIACDGIWDVMSSQEVVEKVHAFLANGRPPPPLPDADANDDAGGAPMAAAAEPPAPAAQRPWDLGAVCEELIDHCLRLGSRDNMSVVIVLFQKGLLKPQPA